MSAPMSLSHARSASTPAAPTLSSYADWERAHSRERRSRSRSNAQPPSPTARPSASILEEEDDAAAADEALPAYSRAAKPPKYSREDKPRLTHAHSLPVAESRSAAQARFPTQLPARSYEPQGIMDMGGVRRYTDGRRPCRVGRDGRCECGKQVMRPESEEARAARRKDQFNLRGRSFWGMMGSSFARAFMI